MSKIFNAHKSFIKTIEKKKSLINIKIEIAFKYMLITPERKQIIPYNVKL